MTTRDRRPIELTNEREAMRVLTLHPGRDTGVWCLARDGSLRPASGEIEGARVFLRFDGARLFIGTQWHELAPPAPTPTEDPRAAYGFGSAWHDVADDDDAAEIDEDVTPLWCPVRALSASPLTPSFPRKAEASGPVTVAASMPRSVLYSACASTGTRRRFSDEETRVRFRRGSSDPPSAPPVAREATARPSRGATLSPVRSAILAMMVVTVAVVAIGSSHRTVASKPRAEKAQNTALVAPHAATAVPVGATPSTSAAPLPSSSPAVPAHSASATLSPAAPGSAAVRAGSPDERAAVMAVESGASDRAGDLYDALATAHPDRPAYREAARILRAKVGTP